MSAPKPATSRQVEYLTRLAAQAGFVSPESACQDILQRTVVLPSPDGQQQAGQGAGFEVLSLQDARSVLTALELRVQPKKTDAPAGHDATAGMPLSAADLKAIASGALDRPEHLDEDSRWVLDRLVMAVKLLQCIPSDMLGGRAVEKGVNGNGPILMEHLLQYFGNWDRLAEAFGVTVPTAKAWGSRVPESRCFEAEVKTRGHVRVPRELRR